MVVLSRRVFPRNKCNIPIELTPTNEVKCCAATVSNYSKTGMYFTSRQAIGQDASIQINMPTYSYGAGCPDSFRIYLAQTVWCRKVQGKSQSIFGSGVRLLKYGCDRQGSDMLTIIQDCDLCGKPSPCAEVIKCSDGVYLCPQCYQYYRSIPEGLLKASITKQILGNVV